MTASSGHRRLPREHDGDPVKHPGLAYDPRPAGQARANGNVIFGSAHAVVLLFTAAADRAGA
jgi:hypothetical protein